MPNPSLCNHSKSHPRFFQLSFENLREKKIVSTILVNQKNVSTFNNNSKSLFWWELFYATLQNIRSCNKNMMHLIQHNVNWYQRHLQVWQRTNFQNVSSYKIVAFVWSKNALIYWNSVLWFGLLSNSNLFFTYNFEQTVPLSFRISAFWNKSQWRKLYSKSSSTFIAAILILSRKLRL